jgi:hypothetical protein
MTSKAATLSGVSGFAVSKAQIYPITLILATAKTKATKGAAARGVVWAVVAGLSGGCSVPASRRVLPQPDGKGAPATRFCHSAA